MDDNKSLEAVKNTNLTFISEESMKVYAQVDQKVSELLDSGLTGLSLTFAKMSVVEEIELALTTDFMKKVMNLQNKSYGFKTDCDLKKNESYPESVVKNCVVQAILHGAEITGNEFNILGGNAYFTKEYCENYLRKNKIWHKLTPGFSKQVGNGIWVVPYVIEYVDPRDKKAYSENVDIPVNKFEKTKEETMRGASKRDALSFIIEKLRGQPIPMGDVSNNIIIDAEHEDIKNENIKSEKTQTDNKSFEIKETKVEEKPETKVEEKLDTVSEELQSSFNKFISNKEKYKDIDGLKKRAEIWCGENGVRSSQLNMSVFSELRNTLLAEQNK